MREKTPVDNKTGKIITSFLVGLAIGVFLLYLEYKTNIFQTYINPNLLDGGHPSSPPYIVDSKDVVISEASTASLFNGELVIAVINASRTLLNADYVDMIISSPGFDVLKVEDQELGDKITYVTYAKYEIQVLGVDYSSYDSAKVSIRITKTISTDMSTTQSALSTQLASSLLTATPTPIFIDQVMDVTINKATTATLFDGDLTISVISASYYSNAVTAVISSPGFPSLQINDVNVGYKITFPGNTTYEIQVLAATDGSYYDNTVPTATFRIVRFKN